MDLECGFSMAYMDRYFANLAVDEYLANASAIIQDLAMTYGDGDPKAVHLATVLFNVSVTYPVCVESGSPKPGCTYDQYFTLLMYTWDLILIRCPVCTEDQSVINNTCVCNEGFIFNATTRKCECPVFEKRVKGSCHCLKNFTRDPVSGRCVCPTGFTINGTSCMPVESSSGLCTCPENEYYDSIHKKCHCLENYFRDPLTGKCVTGKQSHPLITKNENVCS